MSEYGFHRGKIGSGEGQGVDRLRYDIYQIRITLGQIFVDWCVKILEERAARFSDEENMPSMTRGVNSRHASRNLLAAHAYQLNDDDHVSRTLDQALKRCSKIRFPNAPSINRFPSLSSPKCGN
jgi:hypothetical protein